MVNPNVRLLTNIGRLWTGSEVWSNAAILTHGDQIAWVGPAAELPRSLPGVIDDIVDVDDVQNLNGGLVTPGLIDAHTHPVYAGNRWAEIAMRSGGSSSHEIAAAGGGIASTVTVTRGTDPWTLCNGVRTRLREWLLSGTTTIEAKTGYHLTRDGELADVRLLRSLESEPGMPRVHVTFLAAHTVPPEFFGRRHDYVDAVGSWCTDAAAAGRGDLAGRGSAGAHPDLGPAVARVHRVGVRVDEPGRDQPAVQVLHVIHIDDVVDDAGQAPRQLGRRAYPRDLVPVGEDRRVAPHLGTGPQPADVGEQANVYHPCTHPRGSAPQMCVPCVIGHLPWLVRRGGAPPRTRKSQITIMSRPGAGEDAATNKYRFSYGIA